LFTNIPSASAPAAAASRPPPFCSSSSLTCLTLSHRICCCGCCVSCHMMPFGVGSAALCPFSLTDPFSAYCHSAVPLTISVSSCPLKRTEAAFLAAALLRQCATQVAYKLIMPSTFTGLPCQCVFCVDMINVCFPAWFCSVDIPDRRSSKMAEHMMCSVILIHH